MKTEIQLQVSRLIGLILIPLLLIAAGCGVSDSAETDDEDTLTPKEVVEMYINAFNNQNPAELQATLTDNFHSYGLLGAEEAPPVGERLIVGAENYTAFVGALWAAFPDVEITVENVVAEENLVAVRWTSYGTHNGEPLFPGVQPEGQKTQLEAMALFRIENDKIAEKRFQNDDFIWMIQLGAIPLNQTALKISAYTPNVGLKSNSLVEDNKDMIQVYIDAFNNQNPAELQATLTDNFHSFGLLGAEEAPPVGEGVIIGDEIYTAVIGAFWAAFPDLKITVEDVIAEGDLVAVRWTSYGTHNGEPLFPGVEPEGQETQIEAMALFRVENGKIAEKRFRNDDLALMIQLGAIHAF